eukprot:TRINITY_DN13167_c0_g1_i1.p1 TRINITY_DN13167_c0_g1~~TRINITY_DN13167_c0_g1_i1.p1  ORF type:complete len:246 (-),score=58.44 TRINITY_DN13167_c0_g1_i1:129-866(-)
MNSSLKKRKPKKLPKGVALKQAPRTASKPVDGVPSKEGRVTLFTPWTDLSSPIDPSFSLANYFELAPYQESQLLSSPSLNYPTIPTPPPSTSTLTTVAPHTTTLKEDKVEEKVTKKQTKGVGTTIGTKLVPEKKGKEKELEEEIKTETEKGEEVETRKEAVYYRAKKNFHFLLGRPQTGSDDVQKGLLSKLEVNGDVLVFLLEERLMLLNFDDNSSQVLLSATHDEIRNFVKEGRLEKLETRLYD